MIGRNTSLVGKKPKKLRHFDYLFLRNGQDMDFTFSYWICFFEFKGKSKSCWITKKKSLSLLFVMLWYFIFLDGFIQTWWCDWVFYRCVPIKLLQFLMLLYICTMPYILLHTSLTYWNRKLLWCCCHIFKVKYSTIIYINNYR